MIEGERLGITEAEMKSPREKGEALLENKKSTFKEFVSNVFTTGEYQTGEKVANSLSKIGGLALAGMGAKLAIAPSPDALVDPRMYGVLFTALGLSLVGVAIGKTAENRNRLNDKEKM